MSWYTHTASNHHPLSHSNKAFISTMPQQTPTPSPLSLHHTPRQPPPWRRPTSLAPLYIHPSIHPSILSTPHPTLAPPNTHHLHHLPTSLLPNTASGLHHDAICAAKPKQKATTAPTATCTHHHHHHTSGALHHVSPEFREISLVGLVGLFFFFFFFFFSFPFFALFEG
ncbi:uncharacterized protein IWZ02DRAFT_45685 [Phyllosticta citriasiana]|uniref:uncharacterized protein n=1 Tax=Phyllosticta citriasiana TaxID=595635 RepID=UPI0030FD825C